MMQPAYAILAQITPGDILWGLWVVLIYLVTLFLPIGALIYGAYYFISLPLRRQERARLFLDLLDAAFQKGGSVEAQLISMSESRDAAPGLRFHLLAAHLANGLRLDAALDQVPRLLAPRISAMLKTGVKLGDLRKVLPACRQLTQDAVSQTRSGAHYLMVLSFIVTPTVLMILLSLLKVVVPKFKEVFAGMTGARWPMFDLLAASFNGIAFAAIAVIAFMMLAMFLYIGGPRAAGWFKLGFGSLVDWIVWQVPWKRKRMQRDFATMLALLLDNGVPEAEAVRLAADCAANEVFASRAKKVAARLAEGVKLTEAISSLDDAGEFHWRLTNAQHAQGSFMQGLAGWCDALDAKAFQQEQATAQIATTSLVLFNGVIVAFIAIACFGALIAIVKEGLLW
jgi:type IV pilus assembly protein PilC